MEKSKPIKSFVIDRMFWARGDRKGGNQLLDSNGKMCCLGIFSKACGLSDEKLLQKCLPDELDTNDKETLIKNGGAFLFTDGDGTLDEADIVQSFTEANDNPKNPSLCLDEKTRELQLTRLFKSVGVRVKFVGAEKEEGNNE